MWLQSKRSRGLAGLTVVVLLGVLGLAIALVGTASRAGLVMAQEPAEQPRRGCPACHLLEAEPPPLPPFLPEGAFTLAWEAHAATIARWGEDPEHQHPNEAPDGTSLAPIEKVNVTTCLLCHRPGTGRREGKGVAAPLALRDIVHPAHLTSEIFIGEFRGNCFTCHNVNGKGRFELLTLKVRTNPKGVPDPDYLPIPGSIELH